ncbi:hypothetical protein ACFYTQ_33585 [Nocardia sp. NPDC004068]|uniref:hypothetical protein n=1 Tax=Nocardia sp. NPDC004068 TaxID=3364303 RepID=UPI00367C6F57
MRTLEPPTRYGLRHIVETFGVDAVVERIADLRAAGNRPAAACLQAEFASIAARGGYTQRVQRLARALADDPANETVARELAELLAARFPRRV